MYELALFFEDWKTGIVYGMFGERQMVRCGIGSTHIWKGYIKYMPITENDTQYERFLFNDRRK